MWKANKNYLRSIEWCYFQHANYLGQMSSSSKFIVGRTDPTHCRTWTTEVIGEKTVLGMQ